MVNEQERSMLLRIHSILMGSILTLLTPIVIDSYRESCKTDKTVEKVTQVVAGKDGIIDSKEAYSFLKALKYPKLESENPIRGENDRLYFRADSQNPFCYTVGIYVGTEPFRNCFSDCKCIGIVHRERLELLIKKLYK